MKPLVITLLALSTSMSAFAGDIKFISSDDSALSELCIAATVSMENMHDTAKKLGVFRINSETLACNGMPVREFVRKSRASSISAKNEFVSYEFRKRDRSIETEICYAAVTSEQEFNRLKELYSESDADLEEQVRCNNLPINTFTQKYKNREFTASIY